jgi:small multidrug resistance family-3 protein
LQRTALALVVDEANDFSERAHLKPEGVSIGQDFAFRGRQARLLILKTFALFIVTAIAEIVGCYLPYLWLRKQGSPLLLIPALASLAAFAWLLTLHPAASGRVYAAYGGVYVAVALLWLWKVDRASITAWDLAGALVAITGMGIIVWGGWSRA